MVVIMLSLRGVARFAPTPLWVFRDGVRGGVGLAFPSPSVPQIPRHRVERRGQSSGPGGAGTGEEGSLGG